MFVRPPAPWLPTMSDRDEDRQSFLEWMKHAQVLVGLSAVLLSLCGPGVSIYEAHLMRRAQRASVWPYVEIGASVESDRVSVFVQNTGVGPAPIRAAEVTLGGRRMASWAEVLGSVTPAATPTPVVFQSLLNGRVLPSGSTRAPVFVVQVDSGGVGRPVVDSLRAALLGAPPDKALDVTLCYCSVYEECWTSDLLRTLGRKGGEPGAEHRVASCDDMERSAI